MMMSEVTVLFSYTITALLTPHFPISPTDFLCILLHTPSSMQPFPIRNRIEFVKVSLLYHVTRTADTSFTSCLHLWNVRLLCTFTYGCEEARHTGIWQPVCLRQAFEETVDRRSRWSSGSTLRDRSPSLSSPAPNSQRSTQGGEKSDWRQLEGGRDALALAELTQMHMHSHTLVYILPNTCSGYVGQLDL